MRFLGIPTGAVIVTLTDWEKGGILFREYCFGEENSLRFSGKLGEFCEELGEFAFTHK